MPIKTGIVDLKMDMKKHFELYALKLLEEVTVEDIMVSQVIKDVGSCKGTFYKYYLDKYDLCVNALKNCVYSKLDLGETNWKVFLQKYLTLVDENANVLTNAFVSDDINSPRAYNENLVSGVLTNVAKKNGMNVELKESAFFIQVCARSITDITAIYVKHYKGETLSFVADLISGIMPSSLHKYIYPA